MKRYTEVIILAAILVSVLLLVSGCHKKDAYMDVPVSSCTSRYTGRTDNQTIQTGSTCFGYDSKGICTVSVPQYSVVEYREVAYSCNFSKWQ